MGRWVEKVLVRILGGVGRWERNEDSGRVVQ